MGEPVALRYIGLKPLDVDHPAQWGAEPCPAGHYTGTVVPLPEGYPNHDHTEPDADRAAEKVASGFYARVSPPAPARKTRDESGGAV